VIDILVDITLFTFLAIMAVAIVRMRNLFAVVMMFSIFSLIAAGLFVIMDAGDVAFTEAAVGGGISTVLMLAALGLTRSREEKPATRRSWLALLVVTVTGAVLVYGTMDMPAFGDPNAPAHQHVGPRYIEQGQQETGVPNLVAAVLASYRGFDTLGETAVIFTAGMAVLLLIGKHARRRRKAADEGSSE